MSKQRKIEVSANQPLDTQDLAAFEHLVGKRRAVRRFTDRVISDEVLDHCLDMAMLAPSSSNLQPWQFIVVDSPEIKKQAAHWCMNQNAAKTASRLIVCIARTDNWRAHAEDVLRYYPVQPVPKIVQSYYRKLAPMEFKLGLWRSFVPIKWLLVRYMRHVLKKPTPEPRYSIGGIKQWATISSALACENLMLALSAHGFDSCPMGGFDEPALKKLLKLNKHQHILMVIGAGERGEGGIYHPQFRFERERFVSKI